MIIYEMYQGENKTLQDSLAMKYILSGKVPFILVDWITNFKGKCLN